VGIIGRGFGERVVAPAFKDTEGCEVVDVVSPRDGAAVAGLCARSDVDLVSVHSPPFLHLDNVTRAVEGGHAVLCDKPFGRNAAEAREMHELADAAGVLNLLNFETRFGTARSRLRALVREGAAGVPDHARWTHVMNLSRVPLRPYGWLFDAELGGGWLRSIGSHQIDFLRWTFGEIESVSGELHTAIGERPDADGVLHECTADDGFTGVLRTAAGLTASIDSTCAAAVNMPPVMTVSGDEAILELLGDQRIVRHTPAGASEAYAPEGGSGNPLADDTRVYAALLREAVRSGEAGPDLPTFADGLACVEVMDRLQAEARRETR
jgi:predicted dehydrogenase